MINPQADRAVYRQLADLLRAEIAEMRPGARLPAELALQQTHGLGRETVRRALRELRAEGLIAVRSGYGWYVVEPEERQRVRVPRGGSAIARPATRDEQVALEIGPRGWVVEVEIGGRVISVTDAAATRLTLS